MCHQPAYRVAITAALPQLHLLDGRPINPAEAMQYLAALHLQAFQPAPPAPLLLAGPAAVAAGASAATVLPLQSAGHVAVGPPPGDAAGGTSPLQWVQEAPAAAAADWAGAKLSASGTSQLGSSADGVLEATVAASPPTQQQGAVAVPVRGGPEGQLAQLLESCPQLVDSLLKAMRTVEQGACSELPTPAPQQAAQPPLGADHGTPAEQGTTASPGTSGNPTLPQVSTTAAQTEACGAGVEQLQAQVARLQDEIEALNAELEVHGQAAARSQREAAAAVQRAEGQLLEAQKEAAAAVARAQQELAAAQVGLLCLLACACAQAMLA